MGYIPIPDREGWCVEGLEKDGNSFGRYYLKEECFTKEDAKNKCLIDCSISEHDVQKINVYECIM